MQGAGHSIAEVTGVALGVIRFIITDVANPGGSFHIVAAAYAFSRVQVASSLSDYLGQTDGFAASSWLV